jgi:hypothetical protein
MSTTGEAPSATEEQMLRFYSRRLRLLSQGLAQGLVLGAQEQASKRCYFDGLDFEIAVTSWYCWDDGSCAMNRRDFSPDLSC